MRNPATPAHDVFITFHDSLEAALTLHERTPSDQSYRTFSDLITVHSRIRVYILYGVAKEVLPESMWQAQDKVLFKRPSVLIQIEDSATKLRNAAPDMITSTHRWLTEMREDDLTLLELVEEHVGETYDFEKLAQEVGHYIELTKQQQQKRVPWPPALEDAYRKHLPGHGSPATEYVVFQLDDQSDIDYQSFNKRALEHIALMEGSPEIVDSYDALKQTYQRITVEQFLGPLYDYAQRKLIVRGDSELNILFYWDVAEEKPENSVNIFEQATKLSKDLDRYDYSTRGYAEAFTDPPYGLQMTKAEKHAFFSDVTAVLFNNFDDDLEVMQWSTDWSSYFDAGHEWWGSFWWTIHNKTKNQLIIVAASTTD